MDVPLRLLLVADPTAAGLAVEPVRRHVPVEAALAPTRAVLDAALRDAVWDAVLLVPGGPVPDADVAAAVAGQPVPLIVVASGGVPAHLVGAAALALDPAGLDALPFVRTSLAAVAAAASPGALMGAANAALAESARAAASIPAAFAGTSGPPFGLPDAPELRGPPTLPEPAMTREAESLALHLPIGVYRSSADGRILYANPALADILGVEGVDALAAIDVRRDLGYPREAFADELRRNGAVRNHTIRWTNPRGKTVYTRENARAVLDATGEVVFYEGTMEDVTVEAEAREDERLRARYHEAIVRFAEAADGAATPDALHQAAVEALHEATQADWVLLVRHDRPPGPSGEGDPSDARNVAAAWAGSFPASGAAALSADPTFVRLPVVAEPVLLRDVESSPQAWLPESFAQLMRAYGMRGLGCFPLHRAGEPLGALVVGYDSPHTFTPGERQAAEVLAWHLAGHLARHRAEQELRDSEASLRFIAAHSAQVLYRLRYVPVGPDGGGGAQFDYLSPAVEALTGYAPADLDAVGGLSALVDEREVFAGAGLFSGPAPGATHYHAAYRIRTKGGGERWVENHAYPWHDEAGVPVGLVGALQDVTDRKRHENELADAAQQTLARQSALVELSRIDSAEALFARAAELACEAAGADAASVWLVGGPWMVCRALHAPGRDASVVVPSYPVDAFEAALGELHGQRSLAVDAAGTDGRVDRAGFRPLVDAFGLRAFVASPVRRGTETVGMMVVHRTEEAEPWTESETEFASALADAVALAVERDERSRAEGALRRSEARYRVLADLTSDYAFAIWTQPDGRTAIAWATEAFARISGYTPDEVADEPGFRALLHPESLPAVRAGLADLRDRHETRFEARIVTRTGEARWLQHSARLGEAAPDGSRLVYHSGQDVTERKRFEAELVAAREQAEKSRAEAEEMARLKTAFLANMSHEIRTPLTGILGYAELLADEVDPSQQDFVTAISQSGLRLLDTLNSVLDLARLEAEGVRPELTNLDVAAEVRQTVRLLAPLAAKRGLDLDVQAPGPAVASLDGTCLARIVTNLVGNALKFTEAGRVHVAVDVVADGTAGDRVRVRVADTGIGISEAFLPHLFDEFRQETDGPGRSHEGSGLGLSITKRLAELMGGRVEVESRRPGGSTFTVSFPAATPAPSDISEPATPAPFRALPSTGDGALGAVPALVAGPPATSTMLEGVAAAPVSAPVAPPSARPSANPSAAGPPAVPSFSGPPAPFVPDPALTAMFDFRFNRPAVPALEPDPSDGVEWTAPPPAVSGPAPADSGASEPAEAEATAFTGSVGDLPLPSPYAPPAGWAPPGLAPSPGDPSPASSPRPMPPAEPVMLVRPLREDPPPAGGTPAGDGGDPRLPVLVVEDNLDTRMLLDRILRGAYNVTAVGDARSALAAMAQTQFRGFVLDINLGGKETGADVLRIARTLKGYADVYAIALTAYALPGDRERLLESGFDEYISKPFTRQSLLDALAAGVKA